MLFEHTKCKKCNHINPPYKNICSECKSYLRERIVNIDLWDTMRLIIEDPAKAFRNIIFAEYKNFVIFITFFIAIKNLIIARFFSVPELGMNGVETTFVISLMLAIILTSLLIISFSLVQKYVYSKREVKIRFKDIFAVNAYSFIPYLFGLVFIFPVELVVLGGDIFSNNPYSFEIKPLITYILIGFELMTISWSFYLIYQSIITISSNRIYSFIYTLLFFLTWFATLYVSSKIIFDL